MSSVSLCFLPYGPKVFPVVSTDPNSLFSLSLSLYSVRKGPKDMSLKGLQKQVFLLDLFTFGSTGHEIYKLMDQELT